MRIKIAIQKKGRLHDDTLNMFKSAGFQFRRDTTGFIMPCDNAEFDLVLLRDDDIPIVVTNGGCHLGVVGYNVYHEESLANDKIPLNTSKVQNFRFGKCRLSLATTNPNSDGTHYMIYMRDMVNRRIATSYPHTLQNYAQKCGVSVECIKMSGSVEIAPRLGIADAICDLVSSGMTLKENNLAEGETILHSTAILITHKLFDQNNETYKQIIEAIEESTSAKDKKYIMFNCEEKNLEEILNIMSFVESPTVMPLAKKGMNAVHVMCSEDDFRNVHHKLKHAGASSILVMSVEKVM